MFQKYTQTSQKNINVSEVHLNLNLTDDEY